MTLSVTWRPPFQLLLHWDVGEGDNPFSWLLLFTLDPYLILLTIKQGGIKDHFWVFGMTRLRIELRSSGPVANTLLIQLMAQLILSKIFNSSIWPIVKTITDITIPGQNRPGSISDEGVCHITKTLRLKMQLNVLHRRQNGFEYC